MASVPKQDRQAVRTPVDLERKYNLSELGNADVSYNKILNELSQLSAALSAFQTSTNSRLAVLEKAILPSKGDVFYTFSDKTLADIGVANDTICEVTAISGGKMQNAGTYTATFITLNSSATFTLVLTLTESIPSPVNVSDMVYFCEDDDKRLCIAYAVKK